MKAAVLEAVKKLVVKDIPVPKPKDDEVLIKVNCCGICGTDVHLVERNPDTGYIRSSAPAMMK